MKGFLAVIVAVFLAGCAVGSDPALSRYDGLTITKASSGQEYIAATKFKFPGAAPESADALPFCLARVVTAVPASAQPVRFMAEDKRRAVVEGGVKFYDSVLGSTTETLVRYSLDVRIKTDERVFAFDRLDQMLMGSPNMGFISIGAWSGGSGVKAVEALQGVANSINTCLSQ